MSQLQMVATSEIHRHPLNPRRPVTEAKTLVKSVKTHGIISPLNVMPDPEGGYLLIAGERRHFAATTNGLAEVPAVVNDYDEKQAATALAVDNLEREDLSPAEEAQGYLNMASVGLDAKQIARYVNRDVKHVQTHMEVGKLAPGSVEVLHSQAVTLDEALALGEVEDVPEIHAAALEAIAAGRNGHQVIYDAQQAHARHHGWIRVRELAQAQGVTVLDHTPDYTDPERSVEYMPGGLEGHQGMPCLAAAYYPYNQDKIGWYCTAPKSHTKSGAVATDDDKAEASHARRLVIGNNKRFEAMNEIRRDWLTGFLARTTPPKTYLPAVVALMCFQSPSDNLARQHRTEGLDLDALTNASAGMAVIRAMVTTIEDGIDKTVWRSAGSMIGHYLGALKSWGYTLTDPEAMLLDALTTDKNPATLDYSPAE